MDNDNDSGEVIVTWDDGINPKRDVIIRSQSLEEIDREYDPELDEPSCGQCGKRTRGKYVECSNCGTILCDPCDVREWEDSDLGGTVHTHSIDGPLCNNCGGRG